jgi:tripartite ATP-independent transporter DctM subunit
MTEALFGLGLMMTLALLRIPIAIAMGVVGFLGVAYLRDWNFAPAFARVETKVYETGRNYTLSVVPLFILMGNLVTRAGMSQELFRAANTCIGHLRGGLAMATVCACAGFGAICGSSIATAATMAKVAYPAMSQLGYSDRLSTGAIAGGGTLGILIPPSTIMVIYGVLTETNIGKLFAAGILPGILATFLLCLAVQWIVWTDPASGPRGERSTWAQRFVAVLMLFIVVMGGIYGGVFTATEGAGIGAFGGLCFALARRALTWRTLLDSLVESSRTTAMLFAILTGALMFAEFVKLHVDAGGPQESRHVVQPVTDHGDGGYLRHLRDPRHCDGGAVDDPPDGAGVLSAHRAPRPRPHLVRHLNRGGGGDRADQPAGRHEPLRHQRAAAAGADAHGVSWCAAVHGRGRGEARHSRRLSHYLAVVAQPNAVNPPSEKTIAPRGQCGGRQRSRQRRTATVGQRGREGRACRF